MTGPRTHRRRRSRVSVALVAPISWLILVGSAGCTGSSPSDDHDHAVGPTSSVARLTDAIPTPILAWSRCPTLGSAPDPATPGLRCAGLSVPRDYAHPQAGSITLAVSRLSPPGDSAPRPVLISNPGGPGATGLFNTVGVDGAFDGRLAGTFDLVSFDPRGVNRSTPVDCGLTDAQAARATGGRAPSSFASDAAFAEQVATSCAAHRSAETPFVTTLDTVRDVDLLRRALGRDRISWVGTSYGTELAVSYATLYPAHTDRVVLDSPSDVTRPWWQVQAGSAAAADRRFDQIAGQIARRDGDWHLGADVAAVRANYLRTVARLDDQRVMLDGVRVTASDLQSVRLTPALVDDRAIEPLAETMRYLLGVEGAPSAAELIRLLDRFDRTSGSVSDVNGQSLPQQIAAYLTVRCNDTAWPAGPEAYRRATEAEARRYPITRGQFSMINACAFWPPTVREPMPEVTDRGWSGPPNVLLLSATNDYRAYPAGVTNTRRVRGRRAVSITVDDYHHVVAGRSACATDAALAWLLVQAPIDSDRSC